MARMHSGKKCKSGSKKPLERKKPTWLRYSAKEIESLVVKLAKSGKNTSEIGLILRDSYGIPDVEFLTKKRLNKILKENKLESKLPEDLKNLIRRQIAISKHLEKNKQDQTAKRGLLLTESKINRLVKYYKRNKVLPEDWKYTRETAELLAH